MREVLRTQLRILTFRFDAEEVASLGSRHLAFGMLTAWMVGVGRYWDHPDPYPIQLLGVGSLVIPVVLSALIFALLLPLRPARWSYRHLLTFVALTSLPALLYAIPVERFLTLDAARSVNAWFLAVVASWRVALLGSYLRRWAGFGPGLVLVSLLLPLSLIVTALALLNLERAVFDAMSGIRDGEGTANDLAYEILFLLSLLAFFTFPVLLLGYLVAVYLRRRRPRVAQHEV